MEIASPKRNALHIFIGTPESKNVFYNQTPQWYNNQEQDVQNKNNPLSLKRDGASSLALKSENNHVEIRILQRIKRQLIEVKKKNNQSNLHIKEKKLCLVIPSIRLRPKLNKTLNYTRGKRNGIWRPQFNLKATKSAWAERIQSFLNTSPKKENRLNVHSCLFNKQKIPDLATTEKKPYIVTKTTSEKPTRSCRMNLNLTLFDSNKTENWDTQDLFQQLASTNKLITTLRSKSNMSAHKTYFSRTQNQINNTKSTSSTAYENSYNNMNVKENVSYYEYKFPKISQKKNGRHVSPELIRTRPNINISPLLKCKINGRKMGLCEKGSIFQRKAFLNTILK